MEWVEDYSLERRFELDDRDICLATRDYYDQSQGGRRNNLNAEHRTWALLADLTDGQAGKDREDG